MSPTATLNAILLMAMIAAWEDRDVMTVDVLNTFIQTIILDGIKRIIMKVT